MENISYVKLTDPKHFGTVIRMYIIGRQRHHERYKNGKWVQTSLMIDYFMPYGEHFEYYDDITEEEANQSKVSIIQKKRLIIQKVRKGDYYHIYSNDEKSNGYCL